MPKAMHDALDRQATRKGLAGDRKKAYIFGTMQKRGVMKKSKKKGVTMDHAAAALSMHMKGRGTY